MKVTRILHASVNSAAAPERTAEFYGRLLGLRESAFRPDIPGVPGQWFDAGDAQLHLIGLRSAGGGLDPSRHHVCFGVADLDEAVAELDAAGVPYVRASQQHPHGTVEQVFLTDPSGNVVELQEDPAPS